MKADWRRRGVGSFIFAGSSCIVAAVKPLGESSRSAGHWLGLRLYQNRDVAAAVASVVVAAAVTSYFALACWAHAGSLGFPLDDSYIYLTYAKQIARGHPYSYFDGSGFSAGATSLLWPSALAPLYLVGFHGAAFVAAVWGISTLLLAASCGFAFRIAARLAERRGASPAWQCVIGGIAMLFLVGNGPLCWAYLSGMEVPLAGTLALAVVDRLLVSEAPSLGTSALLAALCMSRPEAALLVLVVVALWSWRYARARQWRPLALVASSLVPFAMSAVAYRGLAGHWVPNTAVSKSHFFQPGFTAGYLLHAIDAQGRGLVTSLLTRGPLQPAPWVMLAFVIGAVRMWRGARGAADGMSEAAGDASLDAKAAAERSGSRPTLAYVLLTAGPVLFGVAVLISSGQWRFQNFRYLASAFPLLLVVAALALPPWRINSKAESRAWGRVLASPGLAKAIVVVALGFYGALAIPSLRGQALLYAQGVRDTQAQVVKIGKWVASSLPPSSVIALHDVGAIGYYGEHKLIDIIGLITNGQASACANGPGSRFEALERIPVASRPTHFAYYAGWLLAGNRDLFGKSLLATPLLPALAGAPDRLVGGSNMEVFEADLHLLGSGSAPFATSVAGATGAAAPWAVVDQVDVSDVLDEAAHGYVAALGPRSFGDNTDKWSCYFRSSQANGGALPAAVADGGRTIRGASGESMVLRARGSGPHRLVMRFGGPPELPWSTLAGGPVELVVSDAARGVVLGRVTVPALSGEWVEAVIPLATVPSPFSIRVRSVRGEPYRSFHYFLLAPGG
jgi:hypothetical protein